MDGLNSKFRRSKSEQLVRLQIKMDRDSCPQRSMM